MKKISRLFVILTMAFAMMLIMGCKSDVVAEVSSEPAKNEVVEENQTEPQETIEEYISCNHMQWWQGEWKTEYVTNNAGKELELHYFASVIWPESEEETLAKFLSSEGGTHEEKTRIAQLVCWRKGDSEYPDTIQDVLKFNDYFVIHPEFWNNFANPTDEDYKIARVALESTEKPEYVHYFFREFYEEEFEKNEPNVVTYKTENYVFYN